MPISSDSEEDRPFGLEEAPVKFTVPWRLVDVKALPRHTLAVEFVDGLSGTVEMFDMVHAEDAGVFAALRDEALFAKVGLSYGAVTWPNGLDLAPDAMYDEIKSHGVWAL